MLLWSRIGSHEKALDEIEEQSRALSYIYGFLGHCAHNRQPARSDHMSFEFFDEDTINEVIAEAMQKMEREVARLRAAFDAFEPGLGDRVYADILARWKNGELTAMEVPHALRAELGLHASMVEKRRLDHCDECGGLEGHLEKCSRADGRGARGYASPAGAEALRRTPFDPDS